MSQERPAVSDGDSDEHGSTTSGEDPKKTMVGEAEAVTEEKAKAGEESSDDSLEAILLQATTALLQEPSAEKAPESKTFMGEEGDGIQTPGIVEARITAAHMDDPNPTTSLLDEVANALSAQASEYRDRARGRLPGMPATSAPAAPNADGKVSTAQGGAEFEDPEEDKTGLTPAIISVVDETEFSIETDWHSGVDLHSGVDVHAENATSVGAAVAVQTTGEEATTNGRLAAVEEADGDVGSVAPEADLATADADEARAELAEAAAKAELSAGMDADAEAKADAQLVAGASGPTLFGLPGLTDAARLSEGKPAKVPPVPGLGMGMGMAPTGVTAGPPPGAPARLATPAGGLSTLPLGRMRPPTPAPGSSILNLPAPSVPPGRVTLPPGTMSPFAAGGVPSPDLTATSPSTPISLEASRRISEAVTASAGRNSGRVTRRAGSGITEPVIRPRSAPSSLPAILNAHVRLATLNLAGLIAVTFAGGLLVGMLVWRGQARTEASASPRPGATTGQEAMAVTNAATPAAPSQPATSVVGEAAKTPTVAPIPPAAASSPVEAVPSPSPATTAAVTAAGAAVVTSTPMAKTSSGFPAVGADQGGAKKEVKEPTRASVAASSEAETAQADASATKKRTSVARAARPRRVMAAEGETNAASPAATTGLAIPRTGAVKPPPFHPAAFHPTTPGSGSPVAAGTATGKSLAGSAAVASAKPAATTAANVASPKAAPAVPSKAIATNSTGKSTTKTKSKTAWKDPFAD